MNPQPTTSNSLHCWSEYDQVDPKLSGLYSKGKLAQWNGEVSIDWDQPVDPSSPLHAAAFPMLNLPLFRRLSPSQLDELTARFTCLALSQIVHGEQGALLVASRLVTIAPDFDTKLYASTQTVDEARHVEVFSRYLRRCGDIAPLAPRLGAFLDSVIASRSWLEMMIGMQIIVEGAALSSFHVYRQSTRDPLLAQILGKIIQDEARHVGFGSTQLRNSLHEMSDDEKEELADYAYESVMMFARTRYESFRASEDLLNEFGFTMDEVMRDAAIRIRESGQPLADPSRDGITGFILPTLRRLGLLTDRVEKKFDSAKLPPIMVSSLFDALDMLIIEDI